MHIVLLIVAVVVIAFVDILHQAKRMAQMEIDDENVDTDLAVLMNTSCNVGTPKVLDFTNGQRNFLESEIDKSKTKSLHKMQRETALELVLKRYFEKREQVQKASQLHNGLNGCHEKYINFSKIGDLLSIFSGYRYPQPHETDYAAMINEYDRKTAPKQNVKAVTKKIYKKNTGTPKTSDEEGASSSDEDMN